MKQISAKSSELEVMSAVCFEECIGIHRQRQRGRHSKQRKT